MSVNISVPKSFLPLIGGNEVIVTDGKSVGECLGQLVKRYPAIKEKLFYAGEVETLARGGKLRSKVKILINNKVISGAVLKARVNDGDTIQVKVNIR